MDKVKPSLAKNATPEQIRAYYRNYKRRNRQELNAYNRIWMRRHRRTKRREALQNKASG
jgi:hypothetical protein